MTAEQIQEWINARKKEKPYHVRFCITTPWEAGGWRKLSSSNSIKKVIEILNNNNVKFSNCDTNPGSFNLNQEWIETDIIDAIVEFCGVYPINWNTEDTLKFVRLIEKGKIVVTVDWYDDEGNWVAQNH